MKVKVRQFTHWKFSQHQKLLTSARQRTIAAAIITCLSFSAISVRLLDLMVIRGNCVGNVCNAKDTSLRKNIIDRNGVILATQLITASIHANPKLIIDVEESAKKLHSILPHISYDVLLIRLKSDKNFVWIERHVSPKVQNLLHNAGIPGVYLEQDQKRVYPQGAAVSHIVGKCDVDGRGICGVEQHFDTFLCSHSGSGNSEQFLKLSIDIRAQHILRAELQSAVQKFSAAAANGIVMDVKTGEIVAMVSLPDYDLNKPLKSEMHAFNRNTLGVYEQGSTFKILNAAIALETGVANTASIFDASHPFQIGQFKITDFKGKNRPLSLVEAIVYSSNIAAIKISQKFGPKVQKYFMEKFGILKPLTLEVPELGSTLAPKEWKEVSMMTISYGYGISITPLHALSAIAAIANDGYRPSPTLQFVEASQRELRHESFKDQKCISKKTAKIVRQMMRLALTSGMPIKANIECYKAFGKTGTAYQSMGKKGYGSESQRKRTTSFIGGFPATDPEYVLIIMLDDPKAIEGTYGYAAAGWNAKPTACCVIERLAPLLNVKPNFEEDNVSIDDMMRLTSMSKIDHSDD